MKAVFFLILIILAACAPTEMCNPPYFEYKEMECCLDSDSNNICDIDEKEEDQVIEEDAVSPDQIREEEKKVYDLALAKKASLDAAKDYFRQNQLGITPAYIFESEKTLENIYTLKYKVKYLKNLDEFEIGYLTSTYDLETDEVLSVKFEKE